MKDDFELNNVTEKQINQLCMNIQTKMQPLYQAIDSASQALYEYSKHLHSSLSHIDFEMLRKFPDTRKKQILDLASQGWFLDLNNRFEMFEMSESELVDYFRENTLNISECVCKNFPNRKEIISKAIQAHLNKDYELSIPVFLTQIDGICFDKTNGSSYFLRENKKPKTNQYVNGLADDLRKLYAVILTEILPIGYSDKKEERQTYQRKNPDIIQAFRHAVLHGESVDYANEISSLKLISFLNYLMQIFNDEI